MSLLLAEGHRHARRYPLGVMWSEARIVRQRHNQKALQDAAVMQAVIGTVLGGKNGHQQLQKLLNRIEQSD